MTVAVAFSSSQACAAQPSLHIQLPTTLRSLTAHCGCFDEKQDQKPFNLKSSKATKRTLMHFAANDRFEPILWKNNVLQAQKVLI